MRKEPESPELPVEGPSDEPPPYSPDVALITYIEKSQQLTDESVSPPA